jgi:threonine aldolase
VTTLIDLRSDVVTQPSRGMRDAMAQAQVGADLYREDPTVNLLENQVAKLLGKPAALFVPTGTMGNIIALKAQADVGEEVILEERSHIYNSEMAGLSAVAGLLPRPIRGDASGMMDWDNIRSHIRPSHRSHTRLICFENTHNSAGGTILDQAAIVHACDEAHKLDLLVHLDGARLGNAAAATGRSLAELAAPPDSVMFDFSKGLGAPAGAVLAGSSDFIALARRVRRMLGGGIHQPGMLAAACLYGMHHQLGELQKDHKKAQRLAQGLSEVSGLLVSTHVPTNIVIARLDPALSSTALSAKMRDNGVLAGAMDDASLRFVTHLGVSDEDIEAAIRGIIESVRSLTSTLSSQPGSS